MKKQLTTLFILATIAILTSSCGMPLIGDHVQKKSGTSRLFSSTDSAFSPYVASFEAYGKNLTGDSNFKVGDIPINFGTPEETSFQAVCYIYSNNSREIIIRPEWWQTASEDNKESIIFHELGHCRLDREHDDTVMNIGGHSVKLSMMHHVIVINKDYTDRQSAYINELFTQDKNAVINATTP